MDIHNCLVKLAADLSLVDQRRNLGSHHELGCPQGTFCVLLQDNRFRPSLDSTVKLGTGLSYYNKLMTVEQQKKKHAVPVSHRPAETLPIKVRIHHICSLSIIANAISTTE